MLSKQALLTELPPAPLLRIAATRLVERPSRERGGGVGGHAVDVYDDSMISTMVDVGGLGLVGHIAQAHLSYSW